MKPIACLLRGLILVVFILLLTSCEELVTRRISFHLTNNSAENIAFCIEDESPNLFTKVKAGETRKTQKFVQVWVDEDYKEPTANTTVLLVVYLKDGTVFQKRTNHISGDWCVSASWNGTDIID